MEIDDELVEFENGEFFSEGSNKRMAFAEVALASYVAQSFPTGEIEPGLKADAFLILQTLPTPADVTLARSKLIQSQGN